MNAMSSHVHGMATFFIAPVRRRPIVQCFHIKQSVTATYGTVIAWHEQVRHNALSFPQWLGVQFGPGMLRQQRREKAIHFVGALGPCLIKIVVDRQFKRVTLIPPSIAWESERTQSMTKDVKCLPRRSNALPS